MNTNMSNPITLPKAFLARSVVRVVGAKFRVLPLSNHKGVNKKTTQNWRQRNPSGETTGETARYRVFQTTLQMHGRKIWRVV